MDLPRADAIDPRTWAWLPRLERYTGVRVGELSQLTAADLVTEQGLRCFRVHADDQMASAGVDTLVRSRLLGHKSPLSQAAYTPQDIRRLKAAVYTIP